MTYEFSCTKCNFATFVEAPMEVGPQRKSLICPCGGIARRVYSTNINPNPYHLQEANRFRGDGTDYKEYRKKYDKLWNTREERALSKARDQADRMGAEVVKLKKPKSVIEMAREKGIPLRS